MLTKHEFKNIVEKVENDIGDLVPKHDQSDLLLFAGKLYDHLWEHLKDCD